MRRSLLLMILSLIAFTVGGILRYFFLIGSAGVIMGLAGLYYTDERLNKLRKEIKAGQQAHMDEWKHTESKKQ